MRVERALRVRVAAGRRAEREQRRPVAPVTPDRQSRPDDEADAVAQRVQALDAGDVAHHAKGVAVDVELAAFEARPIGDTGIDEPALKARVAPLAVGREDRIFAAVARVELPQQFTDDGPLVLLHQVPQRHVDRHAAGLDLRDRLRAVVRPMQTRAEHRRRAAGCGRAGRSSGAAVRATASPTCARPLRSNRRQALGRIRASGLRRWPSAIVVLSMRSQPSIP